MITINATGDTTIHTAGKYCPEDILVKVPAGGSSSGGGSSVEMCTGKIIVDAPNMNNFTVYAMDENLQVSTLTIDRKKGGTFTVAKGTIVAVTPWSNLESGVSGNCSECYHSSFGAAFVASGDFTLIYRG